MTIGSKPVQRAYAFAWLAITILAIAAGIIGPEHRTFVSVVAALMVGLEAEAFINKRLAYDTWSEVTWWVNRQLSKVRVPLRGWNVLVAIQAIILARFIYVFFMAWGSPGWFAATIAVLFGWGMHDHWLKPEKYG